MCISTTSGVFRNCWQPASKGAIALQRAVGAAVAAGAGGLGIGHDGWLLERYLEPIEQRIVAQPYRHWFTVVDSPAHRAQSARICQSAQRRRSRAASGDGAPSVRHPPPGHRDRRQRHVRRRADRRLSQDDTRRSAAQRAVRRLSGPGRAGAGDPEIRAAWRLCGSGGRAHCDPCRYRDARRLFAAAACSASRRGCVTGRGRSVWCMARRRLASIWPRRCGRVMWRGACRWWCGRRGALAVIVRGCGVRICLYRRAGAARHRCGVGSFLWAGRRMAGIRARAVRRLP